MLQWMREDKLIALLMGWTAVGVAWAAVADFSNRAHFVKSMHYGDISSQWKTDNVVISCNGEFWSASMAQFGAGQEYVGHQTKTFFVPSTDRGYFMSLCRKEDIRMSTLLADRTPYTEAALVLVPGTLGALMLLRRRMTTKRGGITRLGCGKGHGAAEIEDVGERDVIDDLLEQSHIINMPSFIHIRPGEDILKVQ